MVPFLISMILGSVLVAADPNAPASSEQPAAQTAADESEPRGIATVVEIKGIATAVSRSGQRTLQDGDAIYLDETISTASDSSLQMEVADESLFTISENTTLRMDLFDLDESVRDGHLTATVAKGVFRFVSGKVAKVKPENVEINVPSGTIGIRGTIVIGEIEGEECLVTLEAEEGDKTQHRVIVSNHAGGQVQRIELTKPGFATVLSRQAPPRPAFELPQEKRAQFQQKLPPPLFLPRNAEGRPVMNPNVRDPQKFSGPQQKRDETQKNPGGPNPPNGPQGSGPGNRINEPGSANRGPEPFMGKRPEEIRKPFENREGAAAPKSAGPGNAKFGMGQPQYQNVNQRPGNQGSQGGNQRPKNPPPAPKKQ